MIPLVIHTSNPVLHGWMQFPWVPDDPLMCVWLLCGFLQPPRSIAQPTSQLCQASLHSHAFCAALALDGSNYILYLYVPSRSVLPFHLILEIISLIHTFLYVLRNPSNNSLSSCPKSIRSYTFRANLSQFCEVGIRSDTFYHVPYTRLMFF